MAAKPDNNKSGLLALWVCGGIATALFLMRLGLRKWRRQAFTMGDAWIAVALVCNSLRVVGDYIMFQYGEPLSMFSSLFPLGKKSDLGVVIMRRLDWVEPGQ
jgi:hypothetical protein